MFVFFNPNPDAKRVGDCTVRAIAKALNTVWDKTYLALCVEGLRLHDMPSANNVWGSYLKTNGFRQHALPDTCPECYTVAAFANEHPQGTYVLALSGHVVAVQNGDYYDTWDSGDEVPVYYFEKREEQ